MARAGDDLAPPSPSTTSLIAATKGSSDAVTDRVRNLSITTRGSAVSTTPTYAAFPRAAADRKRASSSARATNCGRTTSCPDSR